ncbi:hypothetical protein ACFFKU_11025 [Kineococcus gynurae]|uniref:Uncharacterized protein n=1 Tax=Kineococcus gynurae TaxID=452979 RepID=A0ABV5LUM8_9ACTN
MRSVVQFIFTLSVALLLLGGGLIVGSQVVALVLGRGEWLATVSDTIGPPTFVAASIAGILAFALSYRGGSGHDEDAQEATDATTTGGEPGPRTVEHGAGPDALTPGGSRRPGASPTA